MGKSRGLLDNQTGLVWGFGRSNVDGMSFSYNGAMLYAGQLYAETPFGYGFTDWRVPSKAELLDAVGRGLYTALNDASHTLGNVTYQNQDLYDNGYWVSDTFINKKTPGKNKQGGYWVNLITGDVMSVGIGSFGRTIVLR